MSRTRLDFAQCKKYAREFEDVISRDESEERLKLLMIISSTVLALFCVVFAVTLHALYHVPDEVLLRTPILKGKINDFWLFFLRGAKQFCSGWVSAANHWCLVTQRSLGNLVSSMDDGVKTT